MLIFAKAVGVLLTPPGIIVLLALVGLLLLIRRRSLGVVVLGLSTLALMLLSMSTVGSALLGTLETPDDAISNPDQSLQERAGAIVVLGGGRYAQAPEYGGDAPNSFTLERLRYGVHLHRTTGLPVLVTGGTAIGGGIPEAQLMQEVLTEDIRAPARWVEARSRNTYENAIHAAAVLRSAGIADVLLVTHAWHMPRALWAFRKAGLKPIPAPMGFATTGEGATILEYLPSASGVLLSSRAISERLGLLWYRLRYRSGTQTAARDTLAPTTRR